MVVSRETYNSLEEIRLKLTDTRGEFVQGVIAECNFVKTPPEFQPIYSQLYSAKRNLEELRELTMAASTSENQVKFLNRLKNATNTSSWNIVKLREDKNNANAITTA